MQRLRDSSKKSYQEQKTIDVEQWLAAIVSTSDDAIISKTLDDRIASWNKAAERMYGYTEDEVIGKPITIVIPKDLWEEEKRNYRKIKRGQHIDHYETTRVRKDGQHIIVSITMSALKDRQGKIIGASKITRDITEKKRIENELARLASLVESSSDAIWSRTLDNKILSWNKGSELMYGYTAREAIGQDMTMLVVPKGKRKELEDIREKVLRGEQIQAHETTRITKDKRLITVSMTISPLKDPQQKIIGISAIVRNITEQKEQERLKDEFISMASHELKTPITSMKMFLDILYSNLEESNSEAKNYVTRIRDQTNKIKELVNDLLDVSRIGTGKLHFYMETFNLEQVLEDTVEGIRPAVRTHRLIFKSTASLPVYGDRFRIYQVITNLLTNAIKYSPREKKIVISAKKNKNDATVSVRDYGIGIAHDKQQKIFDKLYQVTDPKEKTFPGLGIGLYISKEIVMRHNGKMWVKSEKGKGATFYFSLPLKRP